MSKLNVANRTLAIMDNLTFLRSLNNECIDLIAIDPPFATNETFTGKPKPPISRAELNEEKALAKKHGVRYDEGIGTTVKDYWNWDEDVHPDWLARIENDYPPVFAVIKAVETCATENEAAYIAFMAVRLIECRRVLKSTGSIYVHCDPSASHYLKLLLDSIFGQTNFLNEVVWYYRGAGVPHTARARRHDNLLWYARAQGSHYFDPDPIRIPYAEATVERFSHYIGNVRGANDFGQQTLNPKGKHPDDVLTHIQPIAPSAKARTGYPTQKPLALLEDIIASSSNKNAVVLDVFAGCATTAVAAENLGRKWIACDMAYRSWTMLKRRFAINGIALTDMTTVTTDALKGVQPAMSKAKSVTIGPDKLPRRTDRDPEPFHNLSLVRRGRRKGKRATRSATWSGRIPKEEAKQLLIKRFGPVCWGVRI